MSEKISLDSSVLLSLYIPAPQNTKWMNFFLL